MDTESSSIMKMEGFKMGEGRTFDKVFKEQVILRILSGDSTTSKMADEIGVHYTYS